VLKNSPKPIAQQSIAATSLALLGLRAKIWKTALRHIGLRGYAQANVGYARTLGEIVGLIINGDRDA